MPSSSFESLSFKPVLLDLFRLINVGLINTFEVMEPHLCAAVNGWLMHCKVLHLNNW